MRILAAYIILFVHMMDTSIANVALLSITTDLMREPLDGHWVITGFFVGLATVIPFVRRIVDWLGENAALTWSLFLSIAAILACGVADSFAAVVISRFVQGVTSGVVALLLQKLMMKYAGPDQRAYGLSLWASAVSLAAVTGPILGAAILSFLHWHWLFIGQVPVLLAGCWFIREEFSLARPNTGSGFLGLFAALSAMTLCVELGLDAAMQTNQDQTSLMLACAAGGALSFLIIWGLLERGRLALFDWSLLRNRTYLGYASVSASVGAITVATSVVFTVWMLVQLHLGLLDVAKILASGGLISGLLAPLIGKVKNKAVLPFFVVAGLACLCLSFALYARMTESVTLVALVVPRVLAGLGTALCSPCAFLAVSELGPERVLSANSLSLYARTMLGSTAIVLTSGAFDRLRLLFRELAIADGYNAAHARASGPALAQMEAVLGAASALRSMQLIFFAASVFMCVMAALLLGARMRLGSSAKAQLAG